MTRCSLTRRALCASGLALLALAPAAAQEAPARQRLVVALEQHLAADATLTIAPPTLAGSWFLEVATPSPNASARVRLDGREVVAPPTLRGAHPRALRIPVTLAARSTIEVDLQGKPGAALRLRLLGVVPAAALPAGVPSLGVVPYDAGPHRFEARPGGPPHPRCAPEDHVALSLPDARGLFWLEVADAGEKPTSAARVLWNEVAVLREQDLPQRAPLEVPLAILPENALCVRAKAPRGAALAVRLHGWLVDADPPVLEQPADVVAEQTSPAGAVVAYPTPSATDALDPAPVVSCVPPSGALFPPGTTLVTCTAIDAAGNESAVTFTVTVRDTTAPLLEQPADLAVEQTSPAGAVVTYAAPLATDVADPVPTVACAPPSGTLFPPGDTAVVCTATDASGNHSAVSFTVSVRDTTAPLLEQPDDVVVEQTSPAGALVTFATPGATDLVDPAPSVVCMPASGSLFPPGLTLVTCTATDAAGNARVATFEVRVVDTTPPTLAIAAPPAGACVGLAAPLRLAFSDSGAGIDLAALEVRLGGVLVSAAFTPTAGGAEALLSDLPPEARGEGPALLEVAVTDLAGNAAATARELVIDLTPPTLALEPADGAVLLRPATLALRATYSDACGLDLARFRATLDGEAITSSFLIGSAQATAELPAPAAGAHTFAVTIADLAGHETSVVATFELEAEEGPLPDRFELIVVPSASAPPPPSPAPTLLALQEESRTTSGAGNSTRAPGAGKAGATLRRLLEPAYADGISAPAGSAGSELRPGPREVSNAVHAQGALTTNQRLATDLFWMFGQFLDHDLSLSEPDGSEPLPIRVPAGDPWFDPLGTGQAAIPFFRSAPAAGGGPGEPRQQFSVVTAWIDGSQVYGSTPELARALRTHDGGRLRLEADGLLPSDPADPSLFLAGDGRVNENVGLTALHTLFVREHNYHADRIHAARPDLDDEAIYQAARRIVGAELQVIVYREFLPLLLGSDALAPYSGYREPLTTDQAGILTEFSTAAFRLGHTLLSPTLLRLGPGGEPAGPPLALRDAFFRPDLVHQDGIEPILRGGAAQVAQALDPYLVDEVRNFLFGPPGAGGFDLAALNLQRGRDHGLPAYNEARRQLGLAPKASFAEVTSAPELRARLASVYPSVEAIDLWTGMLSEDLLAGAMVGELLREVLRRQFEALRDQDRFFYARRFSGEELAQLERTRLSDVIRRNTSITGAPAQVLTAAGREEEAPDPSGLTAVRVAQEHDLVLRAVSEAGDPVAFDGFVLLQTSDGRLPLHGLVAELSAADHGELVLDGQAYFESLGPITISARSLVPAGVSGATTVLVELGEQPLLVPAPPSEVAADGRVTVSGFSFPGQRVEVVVGGVTLGTAVADARTGAYALEVVLPPGDHMLLVVAGDPLTGAARSSQVYPVSVPVPTPLALELEPATAALAAGERLTLRTFRLLSNGVREEVSALASYFSQDPLIARVSVADGTGRVEALAPGEALISATLGELEAELSLTVSVPTLLTSSPLAGETDVAATRETILRFSAALDPASVSEAAVFATFGGETLTAKRHLSPDGATLTLFYDEPLPASARVRVTVDGGELRAASGALIDADHDGQPGGVAQIDFDTLSLTVVEGTAVCGRVFAARLGTIEEGGGSIHFPLPGVTIRVDGTDLAAITDAYGNYRLEPAPAGKFFVHVDGRTTTLDLPEGAFYPTVGKAFVTVAGLENPMPDTFLPLVAPGTLVPLSDTDPTTVTFSEEVRAQNPEIAGVSLTIAPGSLYHDDGTPGSMLGIAPVPPDRLPGPLPPELDLALVITVQTDGAQNFDVPVAVRFPNLEGLAPGEKMALLSFNHDAGRWEVVGSMTVSADGLWVETDPGVGILAPGWHGVQSLSRLIGGLLELFGLGNQEEGNWGDEPEPTQEGEEDGDGLEKYAECSVLLHSGEERQVRTDLVIPGRGDVHFELKRTYRSQARENGRLGHNWDHSYNEYVVRRPNGDVAYFSGAGRRDVFVRNGDGSFTSPSGFFGVLRAQPDGTLIYRTPDGFKRHFGPTGRLFCHEDRFGNRMTFEYDSRGDLELVLDPYGREVRFEYAEIEEDGPIVFLNEERALDPCDTRGEELLRRLLQPTPRRRLVRVVDFAGRAVAFEYDRNGDLVAARTPAVVGSSTGNDFPEGRVERYLYDSNHTDLVGVFAPATCVETVIDPTTGQTSTHNHTIQALVGFEEHVTTVLNHNLSAVIRPEEVAGGVVRASRQWSYGTGSLGAPNLDKVTSFIEGDLSAQEGVVGGITRFHYMTADELAEFDDLPGTVVRGVELTDRAGNTVQHFFDASSCCVLTRQLTNRDVRPGDPAYFETRSGFDQDGQLLRRRFPEGNEVVYRYDTSGPRAARQNLIEVRRVADPARGGGEDLVTTMTYEPLYQRLASVTGPRGNATGFFPPLGEASAERYTARYFFDYQEGSDPVPEAVTYGIDLSGIARGLGDLNGDGRTDQTAGNLVREQAPSVLLPADSLEAQRLGSTSQAIVTELVWNDAGQLLARIDPEGNVETFEYYPEDDPDGDGRTHFSMWVPLQRTPTGYLKARTLDAGLSPRRRTTTPPQALRTEYGYDPVGNVVRIVDPRGVATEIEVNALNEPVVVTRGADVSRALASGQLVTGEAPLRYQVRSFYDHNGRLVKLEAENRGSTTPGVGPYVERTFSYDILDNLLASTVEVGEGVTLTTQFRYDPNENLARVIQPEGNELVTVYDERDLVFSVTRGAGTPEESTIRIDYDRNGNRIRAHDADDHDGDGLPETTTFTYDGFDRLIAATDALGNRAETHYDVAGNVVRRLARGHPAGRPDLPHTVLADVRFWHDELGRVFRREDDLFLSSGAPLRPVELRDRDGDGVVVARFEYDPLSRMVAAIEDDLEVTRTTFDGASRPVERVDALGNRVVTAYDANSNPVAVRSVEVSEVGLVGTETFVTRYVYDQLGRLVRATDNAGQTSYFSYDSRDNLVARADPEGTPTSDPLGIFPGPINQPGNTCTYVYDGLDRLIRQVCDLRVGGTGAGALDTSNPTNPDGQVTLSFAFDKNSRLVGRSDDNGSTTSWSYDALDRVLRETNADGTFYEFTYDRDDNVRRIKDPAGSIVTKTYDALNRLLQLDVMRAAGVIGTTQETFAYDGLSRLTRATDDNGTASATQTVGYVYDSLGRVLEEQQNGQPVSSVYTGDGKRLRVTYPGGRVIGHTFDAIDRIRLIEDQTQLTGRTLAFSDWVGPGYRELRRIYGNGTKLSFLGDFDVGAVGYDAVQRITRLRHFLPGGQTAFVDREYTYNRASMRTAEVRHDDFGLTDTYRYDSLYRVTETRFDQGGLPGAIARADAAIGYVLDGVGNRRRVDKTVAAGAGDFEVSSQAYAVNAMNEYTAISTGGVGVSRTHSDNGNLADDGRRLFFYDYKNRLVSVFDKASGRPVADYRYFADVRRSQKVVYSETTPGQVVSDTRFLYDGARVCEEQDALGQTLVTYVYSPVYVDEPVELLRTSAHPVGAGEVFFHQNARADVVALTDAAGAVVERRFYDDFGRSYDEGKERVAESAVGNPYGFQGRRLDPETGLYYFRARYYDPETGRFLQRDPVWDAGNFGGQYTFVGNGPVSRRDASGLSPGLQLCNEKRSWYHPAELGKSVFDFVIGDDLKDIAQAFKAAKAEWDMGNYGWAALYAVGGAAMTADVASNFIPGKAAAKKAAQTAATAGATGLSKLGEFLADRYRKWGDKPPKAVPSAPSKKPVVIDVGGEGKTPGAINLNRRTTQTTPADAADVGKPIPNLVQGKADQMPFGDSVADKVVLQNVPVTAATASEAARVVKPGGVVEVVNLDDMAKKQASTVAAASGGQIKSIENVVDQASGQQFPATKITVQMSNE